MAKTRGIACDRCLKIVEVDRDIGWRQVVLRKRVIDNGWDASERKDLCPACAHEMGKWMKAYAKENDDACTAIGPEDQ